MWFLFLLIGGVIGGFVTHIIYISNRVGTLELNYELSSKNQPFMMTLNTSVRRVLNKKFILLDVKSDI